MSSESVQAMAQRFLRSFRGTELLMFGLVDFIRRKPVYCPPHPPPATKKNYAVPNLLKAVYGADFWRVVDGETMKKDLEIFSFSRLSKAWGKPTDDVPEKQNDAILYQLLSNQVARLYTESGMLKGHNKQLTSKKTTEYRQR